MTNLEHLNLILSRKELTIPDFRRVVSDSGSNFLGLKKHLLKDLGEKDFGLSEQSLTDLKRILSMPQAMLNNSHTSN